MAQEVDVELKRCIGKREAAHFIVLLLSAGAWPEQTEARADATNMGVDGYLSLIHI